MKYIDLHCDTISELYRRKDESLSKNSLCIDLKKMQEGEGLLQAFACFVDLESRGGAENAWTYVMRLLDYFEAAGKGTPLKKCLNCNDAEDMIALAVKEAPKTPGGIILPGVRETDDAVYALLTVEEGGILNNDESRLNVLYDRGIRLITLTWNYENCLGYPNSRDYEAMQQGLKPFGKAMVEKMNGLKMIVDVSHLSDGGFYDVADVMKSAGRRFVASHSCARALCAHPRNMTDDMLKVMGNLGGVVGVNYYGAFLNEDGRSDIASIVRHIKYIVNKAGIEAAALGSDFDGFDGGCEIENASQMQRLFEALKSAGFNHGQIEKIAWKNAADLIKTSI